MGVDRGSGDVVVGGHTCVVLGLYSSCFAVSESLRGREPDVYGSTPSSPWLPHILYLFCGSSSRALFTAAVEKNVTYDPSMAARHAVESIGHTSHVRISVCTRF